MTVLSKNTISIINSLLIFIAKLSSIDEIVGSLIKRTHQIGVIDNTIVIFLSLPQEVDDNDVESSPIESNIRRTAFIYSPLLSLKHSISNQLFHVIDILPTLVNATRLKWRTKDRYFIDGLNQWTALNTNGDDVRNTIYGDNFYINNNWKLSYGTPKSIVYESLINTDFVEESSTLDGENNNFDIDTYIKSIESTEIHDILDELPESTIILMRNRAKTHCNTNNMDKPFVIKCSRVSPCLFDLQHDPCELDDKHEHEYDFRKEFMRNTFEQFLKNGIVRDLNVDVHQISLNEHNQTVTGDPILTPSGGFGAFITLILTLVVFISALLVVVCIKERCNSRRSVYVDKSKKVTFKDESDVNVDNRQHISSISAQVQHHKHINNH
jgi:hypothetical protein